MTAVFASVGVESKCFSAAGCKTVKSLKLMRINNSVKVKITNMGVDKFTNSGEINTI